MASSAQWEKQRVELEAINRKFSACLQFVRRADAWQLDDDDGEEIRLNDDARRRLVDEAESRLGSLRDELATKNEQCREAKADLAKFLAKSKEMQKRISSVVEERVKLQSALDDAYGRLSEEKASNEVLREKVERLITDVDMEHDLLTRQQSGLADELRACQVQKEDLEKSVSLKSQELQSVQLENETDLGCVSERDFVKRRIDAKSDNVRHLFQRYEAELTDLYQELRDRNQTEYADVTKAYATKVTALRKQTAEETNRLQEENRDLLSQIHRLIEKLKSLQEESKVQDAQIADLEEVLFLETQGIDDTGITFELTYYKVLLKELTKRKEKPPTGKKKGAMERNSLLPEDNNDDNIVADVVAVVSATEATTSRILRNSNDGDSEEESEKGILT
ncbi:lamin-A-like [Oscarella lobularis]|uniref:lamin-A-like n=1 Tax=Oscarella lobularis TaxID=121494 RepID=UPI003313EC50